MNVMSIRFRIGLCLVGILVATSWGAARDVEVEGSLGVFSRYIWRGNQLSDGAVIQPSVTFKFKEINVNLWGNYDTHQKRINEVDLSVFMSRTFALWEVETGISHFYIFNGLDTTECYGGLCWNGIVKPSARLYVDADRGKGALMQFSLAHERTILPGVKTVVGGTANYSIRDTFLGVNKAGHTFSNWYNGELNAGLLVTLGKRGELRTVAAITFPLSQNAKEALQAANRDGHSYQWYGGITATVQF